MTKDKAIFNWSSGKDSAMALYAAKQANTFDIQCLMTSINSQFDRISMHGVRTSLLEKQAESIGLPLHKLLLPEMPSMEVYDDVVGNAMKQFKADGIDYSIFGDIFLEDLKKYREDQLATIGMKAVFPLWKQPTRQLMENFISDGFKAIIVCVNESCLDKSFVGRFLDRDFLNDIPETVDPCGENGEYHSFVFDGPIFSKPIAFTKGEVVYKTYDQSEKKFGFYYCDLI
jgi:uncharacterized protein (TIGR00290 family)